MGQHGQSVERRGGWIAMAKTVTERVRDYRIRHPEKVRGWYVAYNAKRKERREAVRVAKRAKLQAIFAAAKTSKHKLRMAA